MSWVLNMKHNILIIILIIFSGVCFSDENIDLSGGDLDKNIKKTLTLSPNFDKDKYIVTYSCMSAFVCAIIYDPKTDEHIGFPDMYEALITDMNIKFNVIFSRDSNKVCIDGTSGTDFTIEYKNKCYYLDRKKKELIAIN